MQRMAALLFLCLIESITTVFLTLQLEQVFSPVDKIMLVTVDKLGKKKDGKRCSYIVDHQRFLIYPRTDHSFQFLPGYEVHIDESIDNFEQIVSEQEIPGQRLPLHYTHEQIKTDEAVDENQHFSVSVQIYFPEKRKRIAEC